MWGRVSKVIGSALNALHLRRHPEVFEPAFFGGQAGYDTVVFVHGLHGHFENAWGAFPELLRDDPDLPTLDIWPWSYRASTLAGAHGIAIQSQHLMTGLRTLPASVGHIFLVGHSMGGLVILEGLCHELRAGRANDRPVDLVRHVTLYAPPVDGSQLASAFAFALSFFGAVRHFFSPLLEELRQEGDFCKTLLNDVARRLYHPTIEAGSENQKRHVPITACVASDDVAVNAESVAEIFHTPPVERFPGGHSTIKEPQSRSDLRYRVFQAPLAEHYGRWFSDRAAAARDDATGQWARLELETRCRPALVARLTAHPGLWFETLAEAEQREMLRAYLSLAIQLATARPDMEFGHILNLSFLAFSETLA